MPPSLECGGIVLHPCNHSSGVLYVNSKLAINWPLLEYNIFNKSLYPYSWNPKRQEKGMVKRAKCSEGEKALPGAPTMSLRGCGGMSCETHTIFWWVCGASINTKLYTKLPHRLEQRALWDPPMPCLRKITCVIIYAAVSYDQNCLSWICQQSLRAIIWVDDNPLINVSGYPNRPVYCTLRPTRQKT